MSVGNIPDIKTLSLILLQNIIIYNESEQEVEWNKFKPPFRIFINCHNIILFLCHDTQALVIDVPLAVLVQSWPAQFGYFPNYI